MISDLWSGVLQAHQALGDSELLSWQKVFHKRVPIIMAREKKKKHLFYNVISIPTFNSFTSVKG